MNPQFRRIDCQRKLLFSFKSIKVRLKASEDRCKYKN
nr:MAG TPA: hypothetical protein [Caudoviricetes sp.]